MGQKQYTQTVQTRQFMSCLIKTDKSLLVGSPNEVMRNSVKVWKERKKDQSNCSFVFLPCASSALGESNVVRKMFCGGHISARRLALEGMDHFPAVEIESESNCVLPCLPGS